ncbi:NAD(P)/FAD-dependent oxidoreductase [Gordonia sp. TBRC 11910]|uniref:NAD(P)/FAD-dependent oxidoreductase n=1 Tax=Gordonia asplenii TaxID=2725283 RepID=A0A848KQU7_9ACTN|nr:NAD(P)/FAD-dependent oxidoreductase [Gordonia asplenii]NMO01076.1 NAD(P)/FAD-dependent oxidoreductase [Gordonia asplenii]
MSEKRSDSADADLLDVVIIGAGISGIDAAYRLREDDPNLRYRVLERRARVGGTWDLFRYPGIRSDSDIFTLSFPFEPWRRPEALAQGPDIRRYVEDTAIQEGIADHIRFDEHVQSIEWDSSSDIWTVSSLVDGTPRRRQSRFVYLATGYYNYDEPYTPQFAGVDEFAGVIVHPQHWPEDLDFAGKRIVVIGSGATAVSMIPALARQADHVTMVQRSPSYIASMSQRQKINPIIRKLLPANVAHAVIRARFAAQTAALVHTVHRFPKFGRRVLTAGVRRELPDGYPVDPHFTPTYDPWEQRMCMVPDGDLFAEISSGTVEMVTDHIERFDADGLTLASGRHLDADIIVTATGLALQAFGGIRVYVDGAEVKPNDRFLFKSHLLEEVPNLAWSVGYTNASWTLRADMTARAVAKLLRHMRTEGYTHAYPRLAEASMPTRPLWDLKAGYVLRAPDALPKAGTRGNWQVRHNYYRDAIAHRLDDVTESMVFGKV